MSDLNIDSMAVVGTGTFGEPLRQFFSKSVKDVEGFDKDPVKGDARVDSQEKVVEAVGTMDPDCVVMAITADQQETEGVKMVKEMLAKSKDAESDIKVVVQVNSVQSTVRDVMANTLSEDIVEGSRPVVLVSIHPNHPGGPLSSNQRKIWILTDVTVLGGDEKQRNKLKESVRNSLVERSGDENLLKVDTEKANILVVDLTEGLEDGDNKLDGPKYHDYIAAYYQAVFHLVKLLPGAQESDWYKSNFAHVKASDDLSRSIVGSNPFMEDVRGRFEELLGGDFGRESVMRAVGVLLKEGERKIPEGLRILKTKNVQILEGLVQAEEMLNG